MSVAYWEDIKLGPATILTITEGNTINEYEIEIISLNKNEIKGNKY